MQTPRKKGKMDLKKNIELISMLLPAMAIVAVFSYLPMYGIQLAFKRFKAPLGIGGSPWVGLDNIEFFVKSNTLFRVVKNTLVMNALFITFGIGFSILFAILLYDVTKKWRVKLYQTTAMLPNFLSMVVIAYIVYALLKPNSGLINLVFQAFNIPEPTWYAKAEYWPFILVIVRLWVNTGASSIVFYACLMGVDASILEAADIDGAGRWQKRIYVLLPSLIPIICIRLIMAVGGIFNGDFGLFYNVPRNISALYPTTDVINTYVYRALFEDGNVGMSAAVGVLQSIVGTILLVGTNQIVKKLSPENSLF